jgi:hypothetical protein
MPCERMYLRCLFVSQVWRRRRSRICNETHTPSGTSTPQKEPCHSTIHTRSSGNSSARVKCFSTIPTPKSVSTRRRVPRRATIRIRSSGSLSDPTRPTKALATRKLLSAINTYLRIWPYGFGAAFDLDEYFGLDPVPVVRDAWRVADYPRRRFSFDISQRCSFS